jgi:hypothetical protein
MVVPLRAIVLSLLAIPTIADLNVPFTSYDNDFIEPSYILGKNWNAKTIVAQESIVQWADRLAAQGPWCKFITTTLHHNLTLSVLQLSRPSLFLRPLIIHTIISAGRHSTSDPSSMSIDPCVLTRMLSFWPDCSGVGNTTELTQQQSMSPFHTIASPHIYANFLFLWV